MCMSNTSRYPLFFLSIGDVFSLPIGLLKDRAEAALTLFSRSSQQKQFYFYIRIKKHRLSQECMRIKIAVARLLFSYC